jgi:hypothetical protein
MGVGVYGIKRPADVDPSDIEVIVIYSRTRNSTENQTITKLLGTDVVRPMMSNAELGGSDLEILGGLYNLTLPRDVFSERGFYTIYIRPSQIRVKIEDCADLATFPDIKGLIFNIDQAPVEFSNKFTNNGLDGYRVEYLNNDGTKIPNLYRIITSSFISEPVQVNTPNSSQKTIKYIYNNVGNMLFCTVTPNSAPSFKPTSAPFIGRKDQNVIITNTNFSPQIIEVELVNYDVESLAIGLFADQTKSMDDGIYTVYDFDGNIYAQYDLYEIRDSVDKKLFEVRRRRSVIDTTKTLNNILPNG